MLRNVFCEQIAAGGMSTVIDESTCTGEKPEAQKACSEDDDDSDSMSAPKVSQCCITKTELQSCAKKYRKLRF